MEDKTKQLAPKILNRSTIIWVVLWLAVIACFFQMGSGGKSAEISYSEFKQQVQQGNVESITDKGEQISGADLKNLVNEAALLAGRKTKHKVGAKDFYEARDKILLGYERDEMLSEKEKNHIAYHEAGHALIAKLLPGADPLSKVSIIPRGRALGATEQMPEEDRYNLSRRYLLNRLAIALGGRAAEKLIFDDLTTGAANDLKQVTQLARRMVCQWGMSEKLGPVIYSQGEEHVFLGRELAQQKDFSEHTAQIIDEEIQDMVSVMEDKALHILKHNRDKLDALAEALLKHETLEGEAIDRILDTNSEEVDFDEDQHELVEA